MVAQPDTQRPFAKRLLSAIGMAFGGAFVVCLVAGVLYAAWSYQTWQYEWATGCLPDHGGLSKTEWILGLRPFDDCRPWWVRLIFRDSKI
jgi:hypothetical protein